MSATAATRPGKRWLIGLLVPAVLLLAWWAGTRGTAYSLIPSPGDVVLALQDLAFGQEDDAFSGRLLAHIVASAAGSMAHSCWRRW